MARTVDPVRHAARRGAILDAAARQIATRGYEAVTIADILAEAGVSKGALYHYFAGKEELLIGVIERQIDGWGTAVDSAIGGVHDPVERLTVLVRALATAKTKDLTLLLGALPEGDDAGNAAIFLQLRRASTDRFLPLITVTVEDGIAAGAFRADSAQSASKVVLSLMHEMSACATRGLMAIAVGGSPKDFRSDMRAYLEAIPAILGTTIDSTRFVDTAEIDDWIDAVKKRFRNEV